MKNQEVTNHIHVQTNLIPTELTPQIIEETARGITLFYKDGKFICQTFFTQPILGEINVVEGLEKNAEVYFRSIEWIGPNLLHIRVLGERDNVQAMCMNKDLYRILRGISTTLNHEVRARRYLETISKLPGWNVIISLDQERFNLLNEVLLENKERLIDNIIILGDRLVGLTDDQKVVIGHLTPDILMRSDTRLTTRLLDEVNKLGKVTLLGRVPNSETTFLVTVGNTIYQFDIWGNMIHLNSLEQDVKQINSVNFNHSRTIMATTNGLYEMDVQELPDMIRVTGLPRQIVNPNLKKDFRLALYVDDPYIIGNNPPMGIFAKTADEQVLFF